MENESPQNTPSSKIGERINYEFLPEKMVICIQTPKTSYLGFYLIWLVLWYSLSTIFLVMQIMTGGILITNVVIAYCAGLFVLYAWLWGAYGKEIVTIDKNNLVIKQSIFGHGLQKSFELHQLNHFRTSQYDPPLFSWDRSMQDWGFKGGNVAIDYNGAPIRFGLRLSEQDADILVLKINEFLYTNEKR
jgi:hypothetical protein